MEPQGQPTVEAGRSIADVIEQLSRTPEGIYQSMNANAADTTNAEDLRPGGVLGLNLSGAGRTVGVWDGGAVLSTHVLFNEGGPSRVTVVDTVSANDHSTHVAGTIAGNGTNPAARGMAQGVLVRSRDFNSDVAEMSADAGLIQLSNHSYGYSSGWDGRYSTSQGPRDLWFGDRSESAIEDDNFGRYSSTSQSIDTVLHNNPSLLSVWAAGNDRGDAFTAAHATQYVTYFSTPPALGDYVSNENGGFYVVDNSKYPIPPADGNGGTGYDSVSQGGQTAKNTLVIGSMWDHTTDPHDGAAMTVNSFSSFGTTDDGRLVPHVVGNGNVVTSSLATGTTAYGTMSGTSMATPNVTGTAALLHEHFDNQPGNNGPLAATQKAYLVHTATDVTASPGTVGPDYATGYGMVNANTAATLITEAFTAPLLTRSQHILELTHTNNVAENLAFLATGGPIKATIAWTDPAGTPQLGLDSTTSVLVNDLDLSLTQGLNTYYPWNLDPNNPNAAAFRTALNHRDNLEQVLIDNATAGLPFFVHIGQTGGLQGGLSQNFSLVLSGLTLVPEPGGFALFAVAMAGCCLRLARRQGSGRARALRL